MAVSQPLDLIMDPKGQNTFGIAAPNHVDDAVLTASAAKSFTVPSNAKYCIFNSTHDFFVNYDSTATIPTGTATSDGSGSELNPVLRKIDGITTISVISNDAAYVTISYWS